MQTSLPTLLSRMVERKAWQRSVAQDSLRCVCVCHSTTSLFCSVCYDILIAFILQTPATVHFTGTKGHITIPSPSHTPSSLIVTEQLTRTTTSSSTLAFPLPPLNGEYNYPGSQAMAYEAQAVMDYVKKGCLEAEEFSWEESLWLATMTEKALAAIHKK